MAWNLVKDLRKIYSGLNADEIRNAAFRPVRIGLAATSENGYLALEGLIAPDAFDRATRLQALSASVRLDGTVHHDLDLILCQPGVPVPPRGYVCPVEESDAVFRRIAQDYKDVETALSRAVPSFRRPVADQIILRIAQENALFSLVTALPNIVPSLIELPWAVGEFATDTAFLTMNQVRMALTLAAASDQPVGYMQQKIELGSIAGAALGWRALARQLAGKIPLGGGLIPKAAISFAGTYLLGRTIEKLHRTGSGMTNDEKRAIYTDGYQRGKEKAVELVETIRRN